MKSGALVKEVITLREGDIYSFDASTLHPGRTRSENEATLVPGVSPVVIPREVEQD